MERLGKWARQLVAGAVAASGPVPAHVGLILDGNRRYAAARHLGRAEGHAAGYAKLLQVGGRVWVGGYAKLLWVGEQVGACRPRIVACPRF